MKITESLKKARLSDMRHAIIMGNLERARNILALGYVTCAQFRAVMKEFGHA